MVSSLCARSPERTGIKPENTTASVQGFGNVAQYAIRKYIELGGKVIAISCWDFNDKTAYTYRKKDGINVEELLSITDSFGSIDKEKARASTMEVLPGERLKQDVGYPDPGCSGKPDHQG